MSEFKVGDRVKCVSCDDSEMVLGKTGTIVYIDGDDNQQYGVCFDEWIDGHNLNSCNTTCKKGHGWWLNENDIELVLSNKSIRITVDGTTTVAIIKDGNNVEKRVEAKLSPSDTYNFETGVKIAFERLFGIEPIEMQQVKEVERNAKVGEYVKIVSPFDGSEEYYGKYDICKCIETGDSGCYVTTRGTHPCNRGLNTSYIYHLEYVVLENYSPQQKIYTHEEFDEAIKAERERIYNGINKVFE